MFRQIPHSAGWWQTPAQQTSSVPAKLPHTLCSLSHRVLVSFPGLPRFYLLFAFTIIHGSGRPAKNGKGLGAFISWCRWTWGGCRGGGAQLPKQCTGSSIWAFYWNFGLQTIAWSNYPSWPVRSLLSSLVLFHSRVLLWMQMEGKNGGRPGDETNRVL